MEYQGDEESEIAFCGYKFCGPVDARLRLYAIKVRDPDCLPCDSYPCANINGMEIKVKAKVKEKLSIIIYKGKKIKKLQVNVMIFADLNYVSGSSSTPSSFCCSQLASVVQSQPQCLWRLMVVVHHCITEISN